MSMLDQAFIRAYQAEKSRRAGGDPATVAAGLAATSSGRKPLSTASAAPRRFVDDAHDDASYAPHYGDAAPQAAASDATIVEQSRRLAARLAALNSTAAAKVVEVVEPIDSFEPAPATLSAASDGAELVPAFETQRFHWPRRIEVLIAAAGDEFAAFTDELIERVHNDRKTLLVTGAARGEGRTTLVLALARLAANRGLRVAVVDVDVRAPQLAEQLGLRPEVGWDDAQFNRLDVHEVLVESLDDRVTLLPLRNGFANPRSLAGGGMLREAVRRLREHYDLVLLDVGPLGDDAEAIDAAAALGGADVDDALVVRDRRQSSVKQAHEVCRRVTALGVRHWDVVENFTELQGF